MPFKVPNFAGQTTLICYPYRLACGCEVGRYTPSITLRAGLRGDELVWWCPEGHAVEIPPPATEAKPATRLGQ